MTDDREDADEKERRLLARIIRAERERCAMFIEGQGNVIGHLMARHLAEQIRKGES